MSFLDQIGEALRPHAKALGVNLQVHSDRIVRELVQTNKHLSDLGRGDYDDMWARFSGTTIAPGIVDFQPEIRVPLNEIWLVQSVCIAGTTTNPTFRLQNDNGQVIFSAVGGAFGGAINGDSTVLVSGAIALMPGEHIQLNELVGAGTVTVQIIRRQAPVPARAVQLGTRSESYSGKNTHEPARDFDGRSPRTGWGEDPPQTLASEGMLLAAHSHSRLNVGTLDPTDV